MFGHLLKKKAVTVVIAGGLLVATTGVAYAYWSTTGSGSTSSANASSNGTVAIGASFASGIAPGQSRTVTYTGTNPGDTNLQVATITPVVSLDSASVSAGCLVGDFTISPSTVNRTVLAGTSDVALGTGTLAFANSTSSQDGCKGATVTLTLTSN